MRYLVIPAVLAVTLGLPNVPAAAEAEMEQVRDALAHGNVEDAYRMAAKRVRENPDDSEAWDVLAAYATIEDFSNLNEALWEAVKKHRRPPASAEEPSGSPPEAGQTYYVLATSLRLRAEPQP